MKQNDKKASGRGLRRAGGQLLTAAELAFIAAWRGNATEAVRAAASTVKDPSKHGCVLLKKPRVLKAILRKQARMIDLMAAAEVRRLRKAAARIPEVRNGAAPSGSCPQDERAQVLNSLK